MTTNLASHEPVLSRPSGDYVGRLVIESVHSTQHDGLNFSLSGPIMQQLMYGARNTFKRRYDIWVADVLHRLHERVQSGQVELEPAPRGELQTALRGLDKRAPEYRGMVIVRSGAPPATSPTWSCRSRAEARGRGGRCSSRWWRPRPSGPLERPR
jgi:hypothetical protein